MTTRQGNRINTHGVTLFRGRGLCLGGRVGQLEGVTLWTAGIGACDSTSYFLKCRLSAQGRP